jgi:hypothetical protein
MSSIEFSITYEGELLLKKEDTVAFQTPLYKVNAKESISVPLAKLLNTEPSKIFQSLKKFVGDPVAKGDVIAETASFMSKRIYTREYDGVLKEVNHQEGILIIEAGTENNDYVHCFFVGEVISIEEEKDKTTGMKKATIKLKTKTTKEYELKEASESFGGETVYSKDPIKSGLTADDVNQKVVVDEKIPSYEQIKYEALGAKGFISLHTLPEPSSAQFAKLTGKSDFEKIDEQKLQYCLISKEDMKIFFYE